MSPLDALKDPLARAIDRAVRTLGEQLEGPMQEARERLAAAADTLKNELPASLMADDSFAHLAGASGGGAASRLLAAVSRLDEASSQSGVLQALLEEARSFAGRSAFFLAREQEAACWSGGGFGAADGALPGARLDFGDAMWRRLRNAHGLVRAGSDACAQLATTIGAEAAEEGVFVPFLLRNQLGGFLYAERVNGQPLDVDALRILTHLAALSLETLASRAEGLSATLQEDDAAIDSPLAVYTVAGGEAASTASSAAAAADDGLGPAPQAMRDDGAVEGPGAQSPAPLPAGTAPAEMELADIEPPPLVEPTDTAPVVEMELAEIEPPPLAEPTDTAPAMVELAEDAATSPDIARLDVPPPVPETTPGTAETAPPAAGARSSERNASAGELTPPAITEAHPAGAEDRPPVSVRPPHGVPGDVHFGDETITEQIRVDASFPRIRSEAELAREALGERESDTLELEPIDPALMPKRLADEDLGDQTADLSNQAARHKQPATPAATNSAAMGDDRFATPTSQKTVRVNLEQLGDQAQAPAVASTPPPPPPPPASEDATLMVERSAVYRPPSQPTPEPAKPARKTTEVRPPSDLSGPGSAFGAGGTDGDEALREEARRLARLLVSEIKLYNEDLLEEGRREGNVYLRVQEDIDRSRKLYHERIDPRLKNADDYFLQEAIDRLAGGNADLLGM